MAIREEKRLGHNKEKKAELRIKSGAYDVLNMQHVIYGCQKEDGKSEKKYEGLDPLLA